MPNADHSSKGRIIAGDMAVLARRYAGALFDLAEEKKQLDAVAADMRMLGQLAHENAEFRALAGNPNLARAQLVKSARQIADAARLNPLAGNFLALLAQNRRLSQLGAMCDAFLARLAAARGEFTAEVRVAHPLSPAQAEKLAAELQALAGGKVHMVLAEDKSLLGGLVVKLGSRLIDLSIKSKLARLERQLKDQTWNTLQGAA